MKHNNQGNFVSMNKSFSQEFGILNIPYNPQTNPIESFFSELKHYIKLDSKIEYNDLLKSIKKSIKKIKKSHYKNHFVNSLSKNNYTQKIYNYSLKKRYKS